jgi:hypothetical protein
MAGGAPELPEWRPPERWEREPPIATDMRGLAKVALVLCAVSAALVALTIGFPTLGAQQGTGLFFIYVPPQALLAAFMLLLTEFGSLVLDATAAVASIRYGRWAWAPLFVVLLAITLAGPVATVMKLHDSSSMPLDDGQLLTVIIVSCVALLLVPILAIVLANRLGEP